MRLETTPEQTSKLLNLGFEEPKNTRYIQRAKARNLHSPFIEFGEPEFEGSYAIGELISFLPQVLDKLGFGLKIEYDPNIQLWYMGYLPSNHYTSSFELVDGLVDLLIKLKKEGKL